MDIIFKENGVELSIGDVVTLTMPTDPDNLVGFFNSNIGKKFEEGIVDTLTITISRYDWYEVKLTATATVGGEPVLECFFFQDPDFGNGEWSEDVNYHFLRYVLSKGATV